MINNLLLISLIMSIIVNVIILSLLFRFKDLIKIFLLFRKELKLRGKLELDVKKVKEIVDRLERINDKFKKGDL